MHIKKNKTLFVKRIYLVVRTSYDVFVKPTYALLKKERTDIIVRSFFVKLAPELQIREGIVDNSKIIFFLFLNEYIML